MFITVEGHATRRLDPELAVLHLEAVATHPGRAQALHAVQGLVDELAAELRAMEGQHPGHDATGEGAHPPVLRHTIEAPQAWGDGEQHRASVAIRVVLDGAAALARATARWGERPGLELGHVSWELTEATRARCEQQVLTDAITDAQRRALLMARVLGHHRVRLLELADPGLLGGTTPTPGEPVAALARGASTVQPDQLTVQARVHARFECETGPDEVTPAPGAPAASPR